MTKKTLEWLFLIFAIGGLSYYYLSKVTVLDGERIICHDEKHQGSTLLEDKTRILSVHRWKADEYRVSETLIVCPACGARRREEARQAQIRREREERLARKIAEIEKIERELVVKFCLAFGFTWNTIPPPPEITECSCKPGSNIGFGFRFKNCGTEPIPEGQIKVLVEPIKYIEYNPPGAWLERQRVYGKKEMRQFFENGMFFKERLNPDNSPYYPLSITEITSPGYCCLRKDLEPGQDIFFNGYIICKGHKVNVGTVTVHVMYPR